MDWTKILYDYKNSGVSKKEFCGTRGISCSALQYHLRRHRELSTKQEFLPVRMSKDEKEIIRLELSRDGSMKTQIHLNLNFNWKLW